MKQNEQGRSMIEMLGVLAIIGVLSVGGLAGYAKAMAKHRINKSIDQVVMISTGIKTLFHSQRNYADAGNIDILVKAKVVPSNEVEEIAIQEFNESEYNQRMIEATGGADRYGFCTYGMQIKDAQEYAKCENAWDSGRISDYTRQYYTSESSSKAIITPYGGHMTITPNNQIFDLNLLEVPQSYCLELATLEWGAATDGYTTMAVNGQERSTAEVMSVGEAVTACSGQFNTITLHFK